MSDYATVEQVLEDTIELAGKRALDVGCGTGALVRFMRSKGASPIGLECTEPQMAAAKQADPDNAGDYVEGVAQDLPFEDDSFDLVTFSYSLHHVPIKEMKVAMREAARVLRPGGHLFVAEPAITGPMDELDRLVADETEARAMAQSAVSRAPNYGMIYLRAYEHVEAYSYASADAYIESMQRVDPSRKQDLERKAPQIRDAFERLGEATADGRRFEQPFTVTLLRKDD